MVRETTDKGANGTEKTRKTEEPPKYTPEKLNQLKAKYGDSETGVQNIEKDFREKIRRVLLSILGNDDIDDVYNSALHKIYRGVPKFRGEARFETLIHAIARNEAIIKIRKQRNFGSLDDIMENEGSSKYEKDSGLTPEQTAAQRELATHISTAIDSLPEIYKAAFILVEVQGLTYEEAENILGIPGGTLRSRLARAKKNLAEKLRKTGVTSSNAIPGP